MKYEYTYKKLGRIEIEYDGVMTDISQLPRQDYERFLALVKQLSAVYAVLIERQDSAAPSP